MGQPSIGRTPARARRKGPTWWVPAALVALSVVPVLGAAFRFVELSGGPELLPADARFTASPVPLVVHIVSVIAYPLLGAFQFSAGLRRRRPGWHRTAGRLLVLLGLVVALSALWMTQFYPRPDDSGDLLYVFRLLAGSGMAVSIVLGFAAIRRRDIARHRAWMTRAYALALGAGTQVFHPRHRGGDRRLRRTPHRRPGRRGLGDQPCRRRVDHPSATGPSARSRRGQALMSRRQVPARYELRVDGHLDDHLGLIDGPGTTGGVPA